MHTPMNSPNSTTAPLATTTSLTHIAEVRTLVFGVDEKFAASEAAGFQNRRRQTRLGILKAALAEEVARATQVSEQLAVVRREMAGVGAAVS